MRFLSALIRIFRRGKMEAKDSSLSEVEQEAIRGAAARGMRRSFLDRTGEL